MALKFSVAVRNARLDAIEASIGASAVLKIRTGAAPANITDADAGTVLATINLPSDWMLPASNGSVSKSATWPEVTASAAGIAGHYRIYAADGTTVHEQGSVSMAGGGGDMIVDNTNLAAGQPFSVTQITITDGNA